ncbi:zinc ABC transporter substrate-binding protein ZnuA [Vibrio scophthalmi]|uniref:zinc ABC transporter substrate-binding protein ZnuA n=1 Tax=Vibrio scophthalmi TaxID=45658 RepID=UPI002FF1151D
MKRFLPLFLLILSSKSVVASDIIASIKPIQLISYELTLGINEPDVLLAANTSPHDYALRPSDVRRINQADLIIWFGPELEPFLDKILEGRDNVLTLSKIDDLPLREYQGDHHDHDGHDHGSHDPHFWMGVDTASQVAKAISAKLIEIDPSQQAAYQANLAQFEARLRQQHNEIAAQLSKVKDQGYYVFHDAYGYFEEDYGLNQLGFFTVSPERKPGAKTLIAIRQALSKKEAKCVFSEPQYTPAVVESVTRNTDVNQGVLDPIGADIVVEAGGYFNFMQQMADSFEQCLSD